MESQSKMRRNFERELRETNTGQLLEKSKNCYCPEQDLKNWPLGSTTENATH